MVYDAYNGLNIEDLCEANTNLCNHLDDNFNKSSANTLGCIQTNYVCEKGRPQQRVHGRKYYCTVLSRLHYERKNNPKFTIKNGYDTSHFYCHNQQCINPEHLCFEDHNVNKSRLCCRIYGTTLPGYQCPHPAPFKCHIVSHTAVNTH